MKPIHRMTRFDIYCEIATERQKKGVSADECLDLLLGESSTEALANVLRWLREKPSAKIAVMAPETRPAGTDVSDCGGKAKRGAPLNVGGKMTGLGRA